MIYLIQLEKSKTDLLRTKSSKTVQSRPVPPKPKKAIAIDFDGTLFTEDRYPAVGEPIWPVIRAAIEEQKKGTALILNTLREGSLLGDAVKACSNFGLHFDAINENLPDRIAYWGNNPRKISATEYWDDRNKPLPTDNHQTTPQEAHNADKTSRSAESERSGGQAVHSEVSKPAPEREILFQGRQNHGSEWVEGFYVHVPCGRWGMDEHMIQTIKEDGRMGMLVDVDPSTVGQYTGQTDENGKKIFELVYPRSEQHAKPGD